VPTIDGEQPIQQKEKMNLVTWMQINKLRRLQEGVRVTVISIYFYISDIYYMV
jgi:hypothetical protein